MSISPEPKDINSPEPNDIKSPKRTRIKICGMSDPQEVAAAVALGVDAIGVILHADSPRKIDLEQAKLVRSVVPAFVSLVGVFVNAPADLLRKYYGEAGLDLLQLHGEESSEFAQALGLPYIKAIRAKSAAQVSKDVRQFQGARALLLDPYVKGQHGGTGQALDLELWPKPADVAKSLILAGGLSPHNIAQRLTAVSPYAVDLNSGVEVSPGRKCHDLMAQAVSAVRAHDSVEGVSN